MVVNLCVEQEPDEIVFRVFDVVLHMDRQVRIKFFEAGATVAELGANFFKHQVNGVAEIVAVFKRKPKYTNRLVLHTWGLLLRDKQLATSSVKPRRSWLCGAEPCQYVRRFTDAKTTAAAYRALSMVAPACRVGVEKPNPMKEGVTKHWACNKLPDDTSVWQPPSRTTLHHLAVGVYVAEGQVLTGALTVHSTWLAMLPNVALYSAKKLYLFPTTNLNIQNLGTKADGEFRPSHICGLEV